MSDDPQNPPDDPDSGASYVTVTVSPDPGFELRFDGMTATEELGRPFLIELDLSSGVLNSTISSILGSSVTVTMTAADTTTKRYFNGILVRYAQAGVSGGVYRYRVELRPWIWLLTRTHDCKIFQTMSPMAIIKQVFSDAGFSALKDSRSNQTGDTPTLDYCVQYRESGFDFVTRLMEQYGIYYYFEHTASEHTLVLCDDPNSHTALTNAIPFIFSQTEQRAVVDHIWEWTADLHLQPGAYTYRDYNFTTPAADLTSKSLKPGDGSYGSFEIYDYPGIYDVTDDGTKLATVRMQDLSARVQVFDGKSNARDIRCGCKFTLSQFNEDALNQEYLVIHAVTTMTIAEGASDTRGNLIDTHRVTFSAIPGTTPFRLEQRTPRPMIRGPQTALVVGESGEEITTDQYGRIKVQFYWDRVGTKDQNSSCWMRVSQPWAGAGWGAIVIPRIGMEVVVEFLEGNPDRPLVTGVVYNATQTVPNTLPDKKVLSTMKSNSSKGGGGYNELTFDDTKSNELVTFQAQYNYNKTVLNNEVVNITQDTTTTVKQGNRSVTVSQGNDSHTVTQGDRSVTVSKGNDTHTVSTGNRSATVSTGNDSLTVSAGNLSMTISAGSATMTAGQSITLSVGSNSIAISTSGITISGSMITASATGDMTLSGATIAIN